MIHNFCAVWNTIQYSVPSLMIKLIFLFGYGFYEDNWINVQTNRWLETPTYNMSEDVRLHKQVAMYVVYFLAWDTERRKDILLCTTENTELSFRYVNFSD